MPTKRFCFPLLVFLVAQVYAQESDQVPEPKGKPAFNTHLILKADLATLSKRGAELELELPVGLNNGLVLRGGWEKLNSDIPFNRPGIYEQVYTETDTKFTYWFFVPITSESKSFSPQPFLKIGEFLPTSVLRLQLSMRSYFGKRKHGSRFFVQPGVRLLAFKGLSLSDEQILLSKTTTITVINPTAYIDQEYRETTVSTFRETRVAQGGVNKTVGSLTLDFGLRLQGKYRMTVDLGLRLGGQFGDHFFRLEQNQFAPLLNLGFRI